VRRGFVKGWAGKIQRALTSRRDLWWSAGEIVATMLPWLANVAAEDVGKVVM
jgi:hypothetical protein